jgi:hypothetical protein
LASTRQISHQVSKAITLQAHSLTHHISNTWDPRDPDPAIALMEAWQPPILPPFMFTSICNQVLIPKLHHAIDDWDPRRDPVGVHTWLHPWLPLMSKYFLAVILNQSTKCCTR